MRQRKHITLKTFNEYIDDGMDLERFIKELEQIRDKANKENIYELKIELGTESDGFDSSNAYVSVFGKRVETIQEEKARIKEEKRLEKNRLEMEREHYERLRKKFEKP